MQCLDAVFGGCSDACVRKENYGVTQWNEEKGFKKGGVVEMIYGGMGKIHINRDPIMWKSTRK